MRKYHLNNIVDFSRLIKKKAAVSSFFKDASNINPSVT